MISNNWQKAEKVLNDGGVIVAPTDTLYGILTRALDKKAVERIYKIKGRDATKPFIILVTKIDDLKKFGITADSNVFVPKVSVIVACSNKKLTYLHRGKNSLAFRMIGKRNKNLYNLIMKTGPLVAPSANPQGLSPSKTITEAKKYFESKIDLYINGGTRNSKPSTIISLIGGKIKILRK
ncbi:MAG: L-threonylcarbamoyladenylate synthase [Patescibacteria group bacterium]|nr:L-threonylcarbamoyladenylate synthase [Patescibacteria group bacterium]